PGCAGGRDRRPRADRRASGALGAPVGRIGERRSARARSRERRAQRSGVHRGPARRAPAHRAERRRGRGRGMSSSASDLRTEQAVSAGGVVYRRGERGAEVLLCGRGAEGLWALPKGTPEYGETLAQTALREVREETGVGATIEGSLGSIDYSFSRPAQHVRFDKTVHHFLMRPDGSGATEQHDR